MNQGWNLKDYNFNCKCCQAEVQLRTRLWNGWHQKDEIRQQGYRALKLYGLPSVDAIYWLTEGVSYVRYSFIIWLPTSCALFPNPAAWRTQALVSGVKRPTQGWLLPLLYLSHRMSNKKHWRQTASYQGVQRPHSREGHWVYIFYYTMPPEETVS